MLNRKTPITEFELKINLFKYFEFVKNIHLRRDFQSEIKWSDSIAIPFLPGMGVSEVYELYIAMFLPHPYDTECYNYEFSKYYCYDECMYRNKTMPRRVRYFKQLSFCVSQRRKISCKKLLRLDKHEYHHVTGKPRVILSNSGIYVNTDPRYGFTFLLQQIIGLSTPINSENKQVTQISREVLLQKDRLHHSNIVKYLNCWQQTLDELPNETINQVKSMVDISSGSHRSLVHMHCICMKMNVYSSE